MNPLLTTRQEPFRAGTDNLACFCNRPAKMLNGAILLCVRGEAEISLDMGRYRIASGTDVMILPNAIFSLTDASDDFQVRYFAYSDEMFRVACFRLESSFVHFIKESPCRMHKDSGTLRPVDRLMEASDAIYRDTGNCFREIIAQNLLQVFFLDTYDKVQRYFTRAQIKGGNRKEELFKAFIQQVNTYCATQRDVAFYAERLCISTRYLSAITHKIDGRPAKEIIDEFLILELKGALQSTTLSLKEIAEKYGFPDQSFFARYFRKHTGMPPKEFRQYKT